jgi:hypothetical protein
MRSLRLTVGAVTPEDLVSNTMSSGRRASSRHAHVRREQSFQILVHGSVRETEKGGSVEEEAEGEATRRSGSRSATGGDADEREPGGAFFFPSHDHREGHHFLTTLHSSFFASAQDPTQHTQFTPECVDHIHHFSREHSSPLGLMRDLPIPADDERASRLHDGRHGYRPWVCVRDCCQPYETLRCSNAMVAVMCMTVNSTAASHFNRRGLVRRPG